MIYWVRIGTRNVYFRVWGSGLVGVGVQASVLRFKTPETWQNLKHLGRTVYNPYVANFCGLKGPLCLD